MKKRTRRQIKSTKQTQRSGASFKYFALTALCGTILVAGFFLAGRQHFSAIDYGIKNSRLRKQLDELEAEKRRLLLNREVVLSPSELMKSARRIGFNQYLADTTDVVKTNQTVPAAAKTKPQNPGNDIVQKIVINKPAAPAKSVIDSKLDKREAKKETESRDKKNKG